MKLQKAVCAACMVTLFAAGCATPGEPGPENSTATTATRCAALGAGGAVLGALIGGKSGALKGAAAGLAACAVVEIASRQTRSAAEVDRQYKAANRNQLPPYAKVDAYTTVVTPNGAVKAGEPIKVQSTIRAVSGTQEAVQEVKEQLIAYSPNGDEFKRGEKKVNETGGSGEYTNSFTLTLPQGAPQGIYKLQTQVFVNGKPVSKKDTSVQLAQVDGMPVLAVLSR
jgi:hypothetical protein